MTIKIKKLIDNIKHFTILYYYKIKDYILIEKSGIIVASKNAALNNYKLGLRMLKRNLISDAILRFKLAQFFYKKTSYNLAYNLSYCYFLSGNIKKSLNYLKIAIYLRPDWKKAIQLFKKIDQIESLKLSTSKSEVNNSKS